MKTTDKTLNILIIQSITIVFLVFTSIINYKSNTLLITSQAVQLELNKIFAEECTHDR